MTLHEELRALVQRLEESRRLAHSWGVAQLAERTADELSAILARHPEQAAPGLSEGQAMFEAQWPDHAWESASDIERRKYAEQERRFVARLTAPAHAAQPEPSEPERSQRWRVGHKLGRTLYLDDALVGLIDTPEIAARIVAALNEAERKVDT